MSADIYNHPRPRSEVGNTHRVRHRLLIDKANNNYVNADIFDLFGFIDPGYGGQLLVERVIEATVTLSIDDVTGQMAGPAEMNGVIRGDNFQVRANFLDGKLDGDCSFFLQYNALVEGRANIQLDQALFRDGQRVVSISLSYEYAILRFNDFASLDLPDWSPTDDVWYEVDKHNIFLDVPRLLNLYPALISSDWREKVTTAIRLFTDFNLDLRG